jgi:tellurite resistance protein TerC
MAILVWSGFLLLVLCVVLLDLGVFHRHAHVVTTREALAWTCVWISLALAFNVFVYYRYEYMHRTAEISTAQPLPDDPLAKGKYPVTGREAATQFFTAYILEESLSADNIFVIAMIFAYFGIPLKNQHRLLFWGILGAIVLRGMMIGLGATLIQQFEWVTYVFGALLLVSAAKMMVANTDEIDPERNLAIRLVRRLYPVTPDMSSGKFFVRQEKQLVATPLFLALILVETSDVLFAIDSIPAVFAVTHDPFLVFTSNIFAILGLRSMYFVLAGFMHQFRYLKTSLVFVLAYVGVKMIVARHHPIPNLISLAIIAGILAVGVLASLAATNRDRRRGLVAGDGSSSSASDGKLPPAPAEIPEGGDIPRRDSH